ncbi:MAG: glutamine-hydrolyzing carbamoyl-phosphate synthase small subunit [Deltaproteobacteria bacterium]|jgi:carbamoyl-phosphate synthase small subunit|nr:glutamine-hydrolyzing carbamoyl-phosphate synthase small subunit [Deltaproteobacteria bacterium]
MTKVFRPSKRKKVSLVLEDGSVFGGFSFGASPENEILGEVVFNTGMVGYPESFTDPSYRGQILTLTYPLIGNYGVPAEFEKELTSNYESNQVHMRGLVVSEYSEYHHHWSAKRGLSDLLAEEGVTGIECVDTRALVTKLREKGTMAGCLTTTTPAADIVIPPFHPVSETSVNEIQEYNVDGASKRVGLVDCGCKNTIIRSLTNRGVGVLRVPWDYDITTLDVDGVLFSNGPGDPMDCMPTIDTAKKVLEKGIPAFGICLGNQILALAAGAKTYKLKFGHRSQNQPCHLVGSKRCYITSQNHGYAVDEDSLPDGWEVWFTNLNDGTNEGIRHASRSVMSVQFHPEAMPGPVDTGFLFDEFVSMLK